MALYTSDKFYLRNDIYPRTAVERLP